MHYDTVGEGLSSRAVLLGSEDVGSLRVIVAERGFGNVIRDVSVAVLSTYLRRPCRQ